MRDTTIHQNEFDLIANNIFECDFHGNFDRYYYSTSMFIGDIFFVLLLQLGVNWV